MAAGSLIDVLDECLDDLRDGRATIAECLARYPSYRDQLEPLLNVAVHIAPVTTVLDPSRRLEARGRFIEALYAEPTTPGLGARLRAFFRLPPTFRSGMPGLASVAVVAALVSTTGVLYASEQALPGAPLYGLKLAVEQVRLSAALNDEITAQVRMEIADRRLAEVERAAEIHDTPAMQLAADYYARAVDDAGASIARVPQSDQGVLDRIQENLRRQQETLSRVAQDAPDAAKTSLDRAQEQARTGLQHAAAVAASNDPGRGAARSPATPTARPTSPPPTATSSVIGPTAATAGPGVPAIAPNTPGSTPITATTVTSTRAPDTGPRETHTPTPDLTTTRIIASSVPTATVRTPTVTPARGRQSGDDGDGSDDSSATALPTRTSTPVPATTASTAVPAPTERGRGNVDDDDRGGANGPGRGNQSSPTPVPSSTPPATTTQPPAAPTVIVTEVRSGTSDGGGQTGGQTGNGRSGTATPPEQTKGPTRGPLPSTAPSPPVTARSHDEPGNNGTR